MRSALRQRFLLLLLLALFLRILALPYTSVTNEGDSVPRIFISWQWLEHPSFITHGGWPPFHFYLIAASLWLWFDPIRTPTILHILLSVGTSIPLWAFVRREWGEDGALFASAAFLFYPLSWHLGFLPVSEVPCVFFVALAIYFISRVRATSEVKDAICAGLSMTIAAGMRFEAWALIPMFAILIWGKWKSLFLYLICSSIFPLFWMIGNVTHGLAPISHMTTLREWELKVEGINEGLDAKEIVSRFIYFPMIVFFGLTPPVATLCAFGAWFTWKDREKRILLFPFMALLLIFIVQVIRGLGATTARFSLILGFLFIPFSAAAIQKISGKKWWKAAAVLCIVLMIPFSYLHVAWYRLAGKDFPNPFPADLEAIPKIRNETKEIARIARANLEDDKDGLLIDFFGRDFYPWKDTFSVALLSHNHPSQIFIMPGGRYEPLNFGALRVFLHDHPSGVLLYSNESRFIDLKRSALSVVAQIGEFNLILHPVRSIKSITIYHYSVNGPISRSQPPPKP